MTVRLYRWTDASAPQLSGTAGDLVNVLDKVLVDGYGVSTPAGWTKPFTATNARVYRQSTTSPALGQYVRVNDTGALLGADEAAGTPTVKEARIRAYESMTALSTGTLAFPTVAAAASGFFARKSNTADAITRPWLMIADQLTFYMFVLTGDLANTYFGWGFGEYFSFKSGDIGRNILFGRTTENNATAAVDPFLQASNFVGTSNSTGSGSRSVNRSYTGAPGALVTTAINLMGDSTFNSGIDYTNPADNRVYLSPMRLSENSGTNTGSYRGRIRGIWQYGHTNATGSDMDTYSGSGDLAGRSFLFLKSIATAGASPSNIIAIETSNTWDANLT